MFLCWNSEQFYDVTVNNLPRVNRTMNSCVRKRSDDYNKVSIKKYNFDLNN